MNSSAAHLGCHPLSIRLYLASGHGFVGRSGLERHGLFAALDSTPRKNPPPAHRDHRQPSPCASSTTAPLPGPPAEATKPSCACPFRPTPAISISSISVPRSRAKPSCSKATSAHRVLTATLDHARGDARRVDWRIETTGQFQTRQLVDGPPAPPTNPIVPHRPTAISSPRPSRSTGRPTASNPGSTGPACAVTRVAAVAFRRAGLRLSPGQRPLQLSARNRVELRRRLPAVAHRLRWILPDFHRRLSRQ